MGGEQSKQQHPNHDAPPHLPNNNTHAVNQARQAAANAAPTRLVRPRGAPAAAAPAAHPAAAAASGGVRPWGEEGGELRVVELFAHSNFGPRNDLKGCLDEVPNYSLHAAALALAHACRTPPERVVEIEAQVLREAKKLGVREAWGVGGEAGKDAKFTFLNKLAVLLLLMKDQRPDDQARSSYFSIFKASGPGIQFHRLSQIGGMLNAALADDRGVGAHAYHGALPLAKILLSVFHQMAQNTAQPDTGRKDAHYAVQFGLAPGKLSRLEFPTTLFVTYIVPKGLTDIRGHFIDDGEATFNHNASIQECGFVHASTTPPPPEFDNDDNDGILVLEIDLTTPKSRDNDRGLVVDVSGFTGDFEPVFVLVPPTMVEVREVEKRGKRVHVKGSLRPRREYEFMSPKALAESSSPSVKTADDVEEICGVVWEETTHVARVVELWEKLVSKSSHDVVSLARVGAAIQQKCVHSAEVRMAFSEHPRARVATENCLKHVVSNKADKAHLQARQALAVAACGVWEALCAGRLEQQKASADGKREAVGVFSGLTEDNCVVFLKLLEQHPACAEVTAAALRALLGTLVLVGDSPLQARIGGELFSGGLGVRILEAHGDRREVVEPWCMLVGWIGTATQQLANTAIEMATNVWKVLQRHQMDTRVARAASIALSNLRVHTEYARPLFRTASEKWIVLNTNFGPEYHKPTPAAAAAADAGHVGEELGSAVRDFFLLADVGGAVQGRIPDAVVRCIPFYFKGGYDLGTDFDIVALSDKVDERRKLRGKLDDMKALELQLEVAKEEKVRMNDQVEYSKGLVAEVERLKHIKDNLEQQVRNSRSGWDQDAMQQIAALHQRCAELEADRKAKEDAEAAANQRVRELNEQNEADQYVRWNLTETNKKLQDLLTNVAASKQTLEEENRQLQAQLQQLKIVHRELGRRHEEQLSLSRQQSLASPTFEQPPTRWDERLQQSVMSAGSNDWQHVSGSEGGSHGTRSHDEYTTRQPHGHGHGGGAASGVASASAEGHENVNEDEFVTRVLSKTHEFSKIPNLAYDHASENRIGSLLHNGKLDKKTVFQWANGVRVLLPSHVWAVIPAYIKLMQTFPDPEIARLYNSLTPLSFVRRLVQKKAIMFERLSAQKDEWLLRDGLRRSGKWNVGEGIQGAPPVVDYLSNMEIKFASHVVISSYSYYVNDGRQRNEGIFGDFGSYETQGVTMTASGMSFQDQKLDWQEIIVDETRNESQGYGARADPQHPFAAYRRMMAQTIGETFLPSFAEAEEECNSAKASGTGCRYTQFEISDLPGKSLYVDGLAYTRRVRIQAQLFLAEANSRGEEAGKKVYLHVCGDGFCVENGLNSDLRANTQIKHFARGWAEAIQTTAWTHINVIDFGSIEGILSYFDSSTQRVSVRATGRDPHAKLADEYSDNLLVEICYNNPNAVAGNVYWTAGTEKETAEVSNASSSLIGQLHNPIINTRVGEAQTVHVSEAGQVVRAQ